MAGLAVGMSACGGRSLVAVRESGDWNYRNARYDEALADYQEYVQRSPGRAEVHHMLGRTYLAQGQTGLAREQLYLAHTLRLEDDDIFRSLCEGLYADKKFDDLSRLLRTRTIDRGRMQDWALLAEFSEKLGDRDEAQRAWFTAAQVDPASPAPQVGLAKLYAAVGDRKRALQRAAKAYRLDPTNAEVNALVKQLGEVPGPTFRLTSEPTDEVIMMDPAPGSPAPASGGTPMNPAGAAAPSGRP
jgi:cytochrome c-type biogenesis protein CcmH/NrfG